ncbi:aldehyde dehydrogenase [Balneatrix alpica]|uniref:Aldehyde dehydrogenase n=1 Tax=Balneatrix alpica TaxID=75684 RepID=A0ABV5ZF45_9GAMM|nr:aldehyde dehydrogenase [Balneatrix alpica]
MADMIDLAGWQARALELRIPTQALINGEQRAALSGKTFAALNPATGQVLGQVAECDSADVELAVQSARAAFEDGRWSRQSPAARKKVLQRFAALIEAHKEELALLETLNVGKPIRDSLAIDVPATARCIAWYGEAIDKIYDEVAPTAANSLATITREPVGVVAAVVPWNFPMIMAAWKLGPALAAGNSVILKPAEQSPLTAIRLGELALEAGIPAGVFNVLPGFGPTAGKALGLHMDVDCLAFTGSTQVGKMFMQYAGQSNLKHVGLECGGKSPHIILDDVEDVEAAATAAAWGIYFNQGEMCTAGSRLIVQEGIEEQVLAKISEVVKGLQPGNPLDPNTSMGAIIDKGQMNRVLDYIQIGQDEGAQLHFGGRQVLQESGGNFIEPTLFRGVGNQMRIAQEEIFGPVLSVIRVKDAEEALKVANDTCYGLGAAVWSSNINTVHKISRGLRAGVVYVNCYDADDITVPFGGYKMSGLGRDKSLHAFDKYTELKTTWIRLS